jgi:hypothetical protein
VARDPVHVSVPRNRRIRLDGIQPLFTLVDLAASLEPDPLEAAINEADRLGLVDPETLERALDRTPKFPGTGVMRKTLGRYSRTDSNLEDRRRDQAHLVAGRTQLRFPNVQIRESPDEVAAILVAVMRRLA